MNGVGDLIIAKAQRGMCWTSHLVPLKGAAYKHLEPRCSPLGSPRCNGDPAANGRLGGDVQMLAICRL
jgi:hypothetical protein